MQKAKIVLDFFDKFYFQLNDFRHEFVITGTPDFWHLLAEWKFEKNVGCLPDS